MLRSAALAQYGAVKHDAQAEYASAHKLTLMLFDGAIESLGVAIIAMIKQDQSMKSKHLTRSINIVNGLKDSLDLKQGDLAVNLYALYQYIADKLFDANFNGDKDSVEEAKHLLVEVRDSWQKIPEDKHNMSARKAF